MRGCTCSSSVVMETTAGDRVCADFLEWLADCGHVDQLQQQCRRHRDADRVREAAGSCMNAPPPTHFLRALLCSSSSSPWTPVSSCNAVVREAAAAGKAMHYLCTLQLNWVTYFCTHLSVHGEYCRKYITCSVLRCPLIFKSLCRCALRPSLHWSGYPASARPHSCCLCSD